MTAEELCDRLRSDRAYYAQALEALRSGRIRIAVDQVDVTEERVRALEHIVAEIDRALDGLGGTPAAG